MFLYWGRRGALNQFTLNLGREALRNASIVPTVSISRQSLNFAAYGEMSEALFPVNTFKTNVGACTKAWQVPLLRRKLLERIARDRTQVVITLMPHVWTSLMAPEIRRSGVRYATIIHDADPHPGDPTSVLHRWLLRDALVADHVFTLSGAVARRLVEQARVPSSRITPLFHPDLVYGPRAEFRPPEPGEPLRLLFFGRILPYKGLSLLLDAVEVLTKQGIAVELGVFGEGPLGSDAERLARLGAEVVNRWLPDDEISAIIQRYHAIILSHTEASQSAVAATAFGMGCPVIATPVGGLTEQIRNDETGVLAVDVDAESLADATKRLLLDSVLYQKICHRIWAERETRSMTRFVQDCVTSALRI